MKKKSVIKIIVVDDHLIVRKGLKKILDETPDIEVVAEASSGQEFLSKVSKEKYDMVLLDIFLPDMSGLDILKYLRAQKPGLPVLILSMYPEEQYAVRTLKAGASGYLNKASLSEELISAIRKVREGRKYVSPALAEKLACDLDAGSEKPPHENLSDREYQVMCMIGSGKRVKDIAEELFLSVKTISTYRSRILEKMKIKNNAELIHYAVKNKLA
ncbi:response regulator transcription factor [bacterium]|nr:response regulator transcription factor [bacterium]MBU3929530.1 response regulator transcription factor [bacterium]MBU4122765.1 response regulator transcription factor [bacterium]